MSMCRTRLLSSCSAVANGVIALACGSQAASRPSGFATAVHTASAKSTTVWDWFRPFGTTSALLNVAPAQPYDPDVTQAHFVMKLVKNGADPATLVDYLRELKRNATSLERKELEVEKARLKGEILRVEKDLEVEKARSDAAQARSQVKVVTLQAELKQTTAKYLLVRGLLHMRGLMEYHQEMMGDTWDKWNASDSWEDFINETGKLKACLEEHKLDAKSGGKLLAKMYRKLSDDIHGTSPAQLLAGEKVWIGPPLDQEMRKAMVCLCELAQVDYQLV